MELFYDFKGADPANKYTEIDKLINDVGLLDKRYDLGSKLSGGQKRKLSAILAFCGGSKLIIMDEPTSSLDLNARRQMWTMLQEHKKDRIVLITTHYMDEADILGDRIGIMVNGKIKCLGSSMFLKNKIGVGYNLTIIKADSASNLKVLPYVTDVFGPEVAQVSEISTEMTINIPSKYADQFADFFVGFDRECENLGVVGYGISLSTLEEVFMKVGHLEDGEGEDINDQTRQ